MKQLTTVVALLAFSHFTHAQVQPSTEQISEAQRRLDARQAAREGPGTRPTTSPTASTNPARVRGPWLGIQMFDMDDFRQLNTKNDDGTPSVPPVAKGVFIYKLFDKGSAMTAGLKAGDIITQIDEQAMPDRQGLLAWIERAEIGRQYRVHYVRCIAGKWEAGELTMTALTADESGKRSAAALMDIERQIGQRGDAALAVKPIGFILIGKRFQKAGTDSNMAFDAIGLTYVCRNNSEKPVRAFSGTLIFTDLFDKEIIRIDLSCTATSNTKVIDIGKEDESSHKGIKFDKSSADQQTLLTTDLDDMKTRFELREILFSDGTRLTIPLPGNLRPASSAPVSDER